MLLQFCLVEIRVLLQLDGHVSKAQVHMHCYGGVDEVGFCVWDCGDVLRPYPTCP